MPIEERVGNRQSSTRVIGLPTRTSVDEAPGKSTVTRREGTDDRRAREFNTWADVVKGNANAKDTEEQQRIITENKGFRKRIIRTKQSR